MYGFNINLAKGGPVKQYCVIALLAVSKNNLLSIYYLSDKTYYTYEFDNAMRFDDVDDAKKTYHNMKKKFVEWAQEGAGITIVDAKILRIREQPEVEMVFDSDGREQYEFKEIYKPE